MIPPMKAMILAAGLGTRLLPLTKKKPKPLFPIAGRPLIDIIIRKLQASGCEAVIMNTNHLAEMIDQFIKGQDYGIPVQTRYEPTILGTGGAIKNVEDFWHEAPLLVVNCDIFTNIDFGRIYRFHLGHKDPATLVLHGCPPFNQVWVDETDHIAGFGDSTPCPPRLAEPSSNYRKLAFTGIHVIDPQVLDFLADKNFHSIVDAYCEMIKAGMNPKGFVARNHYWYDIGTLAGYRAASREAVGRKALQQRFPAAEPAQLAWSGLKGDGSDRTWYRVSFAATAGPAPPSSIGPDLGPDLVFKGSSLFGRRSARAGPHNRLVRSIRASGAGAGFKAKGLGGGGGELPHPEQPSIILVDHGPPPETGTCEADAFAAIGRHLEKKGVPVPSIFCYDRPTGLVALEDLGDLHLQTVIRRTGDQGEILFHYGAVIDLLISMGIEGAKEFDPAWTFQTPYYDRDLILERESKYFVSAFLNGYAGLGVKFENLKEEFEVLAERSLEAGYNGFLHRDFQSRNILVKNRKYYVIDFQGGRLGPLQYDLASLLIDPYVKLPESLRETLLTYYLSRLSDFVSVDRPDFLHAYEYCAINRNLQILSAFAFLSREKGKNVFETYIPAALASLKIRLGKIESDVCPRLNRVVNSI